MVAELAQIAVVILLVVILRWMVFWIGRRKCVGRNKNFKFLSEEGGFQTENLNDQYLVILFGSVDRMDSSVLFQGWYWIMYVAGLCIAGHPIPIPQASYLE